MYAVKILESDTASAVLTFTLFSLGPSLSSSRLPTSPHTSIVGPSLHVSTIAPAFEIISFDAPTPTHVAGGFSAAGFVLAVVPASVGFCARPSSGAGAALPEQSSTSQAPVSFSLFRSCAIKILAG